MNLDTIKIKLKELLAVNPNIHINVNLSNPKVRLQNEKATLKKVYPHIFIIEEKGSGTTKTYVLQYTDILTGRIEILELKN